MGTIILIGYPRFTQSKHDMFGSRTYRYWGKGIEYLALMSPKVPKEGETAGVCECF